ncbi:nucleoside-diphosphate sugar epimerase [Actinorhabdospora filicis]|uniref:Nucleoside-diphosphate sugar epimerase n=1 Tax=Actinorhabdospora filicis TaxID=1785913 RepID=A0A9W6SKT1_9ACTN|nr:TIGR01777 family oxidoreductase [Actinorhabdospora filicis]GLZ77818.1 nucleoside-diphosphate sugar epimerase [Actinorhabdospora filicis]
MGIRYTTTVDAPIAEVYAWHTRPGAVVRLTPPWQPLTVLREAASLRDGVAQMRVPPGFRVTARHVPTGHTPPTRFTDELAAPLPWRHTHDFADTGDGRTLMTDTVDTPVPAWVLRPMFRYRHRQLADDLATHAHLAAEPRTIAVTGASGLIGTALTALLTTGGHHVVRLVRGRPRHGERHWDPDAPAADLLDGVDAVAHLAGAPIAGRFTAAHKNAVRDSRVEPTRRLAALAGHAGVPVFVSASAVGFYGPDRGDEILDESSPRGEGFLAGLVGEWEDATAPAAEAGTRVVCIRTGIAQSPRGGALRLLWPLFAAGLGGRIGDGRQWTSWIGIDDIADVYLRALVDERLSGPVNGVTDALRNAEYSCVLAAVLGRRARLPVPGFAPALLLGEEGAREFAMAGQRVVPGRLREVGHRFRWPRLAGALGHVLGRG